MSILCQYRGVIFITNTRHGKLFVDSQDATCRTVHLKKGKYVFDERNMLHIIIVELVGRSAALHIGNTIPTMLQQKSQYHDLYGALSNQHLPEEDHDIGMNIGAEYSSPIKFSPDSSLAPTEDSISTCHTLPLNQHESDDLSLVKRNSPTADSRLGMASNFSAAYNTFNISLALALMRSSHPPDTSSDITSCSSAVIGGMIVGQLVGGLLGDWMGRHMAMAIVMCVQVVSAVMSAFSGTLILTNDVSIYTELAWWRFFLGFGCGGVYPLSATITAESSSEKGNRPRLLAKMFSMQGVAYLTVPLIAYALVLIFGERSDVAWRLLLGIGSLPGLLLIIIRLYHRRNSLQSSNNDSFKQQKATHVRLQPTSMLEQIRNEDKLGHKLVGTAGCWLLFDVLFYGNTLFQPRVLRSAFGQSETELDLIRDGIIIGLMALPGKRTSRSSKSLW